MIVLSTTPITINAWLMQLRTLVRAKDEADQAALLSFQRPLAADFGAYAFCEASAVHVARDCWATPAYGRVHASLRAWRAEQGVVLVLPAPPMLALAAPPPPPVDAAAEVDDVRQVDGWVVQYEAAEPSLGRRIAAQTLLAKLERHRSDLLARYGDRLDAVIWPRAKQDRVAQVIEPEPQAPRVVAVSGRPARVVPARLQLVDAEAALRRNPRNEAMRSRVAALQQRAAAEQQTESEQEGQSWTA